jgi:hypothetical protein
MSDWPLLQAAYDRLPLDVFTLMLEFIPPKRQPKPPHYPSGLDRQLKTLQTSPKLSPMGLYGLEDFLPRK